MSRVDELEAAVRAVIGAELIGNPNPEIFTQAEVALRELAAIAQDGQTIKGGQCCGEGSGLWRPAADRVPRISESLPLAATKSKEEQMSSSKIRVCEYCGGYHEALCPRVLEIEYFDTGGVRRVKLNPDVPILSTPMRVRDGAE